MGIFERAAKFGASFFESGSQTALGKIVAPLETHSREQYGKLAKMIGEPGGGNKLAPNFAALSNIPIINSSDQTE
ncbi:MAG: hypothetical protein ACKO96_48560, partial [Flammeovirgaceae bacterium]